MSAAESPAGASEGGCAGECPCEAPGRSEGSFTSVEWWELRGRGWVANILGVPGLDPRPFVGQQVEIDGKAYVAKGVETYRVMDATGMDFGILVGER